MEPAWANSTRARKSSSKGDLLMKYSGNLFPTMAESCAVVNMIVRIMNLWNCRPSATKSPMTHAIAIRQTDSFEATERRSP
jgi:hypothetical protein